MKIFQLNIKCYDMVAMKNFYQDVLEMELISESEMAFAVMAGTTKIVFEKDESIPFYHLCFRLSEQYFEYIYQKLGKMSLLLPNEEGNYSHFWKGKQAYFIDPDGNILEILERPFLWGTENQGKGWHDVGEIGVPVHNVAYMQKTLSSFLKNDYPAESDSFAFYGDQKGVLVIVREGRNWYPTERGATIHPIKMVVSGDKDGRFYLESYPYEIIIKREWECELPAVQMRVARPTNQLDKLAQFYGEGLGLKKIGEFRNHEGYDGMMFGMPSSGYHLEFTQTIQPMDLPIPTKEHLIVFYIPDRYKRDRITKRLIEMGYSTVEPENPYWGNGGITFEDPDGWRVVLMNTVGI